MIEIQLLHANDTNTLTHVAPGVFDDPIDERSTRLFLSDPNHRLVVAVEKDVVVGFVSAVVYFHPDKTGPEMWINEVGVAPDYRRRGIGRQLIERALAEARDAGCVEAWVLTERHNTGAMSLYETVGGVQGDPHTTMFTFRL
jgi:ribosomal protein S18 acetylase RimI-like enzyme